MELPITSAHDGIRLDKFLKGELPRFPAGALYRLLRKKKIRLNGRPVADLKTPLAAGDTVTLEEFSATARAGASGFHYDFRILFEDSLLLVVDKPRGLAVHAGKGEGGRTVIEAARGRAKFYEPFLVHRLDKFTSGVLVIAKDRRTAGRLSALIRESRKTYLAVVFGKADKAGTISDPLDGRPALTRFRRLKRLPWRETALSLLEANIATGRTHQIRRHLAALGTPLAGDDDYGDWELNKAFREDFRIKEYLLHARALTIRHPESGDVLTFQASVTEEFKAVFGDIGWEG